MHAASVHPEPGSNSLKIYYIRFRVIYFLELILAILLFEFFSMCFNEIPSHFSVLEILLFNFQRPMRRTGLLSATFLLYTILSHLSSLFWKFFQLFSGFFRSDLMYSAALSGLPTREASTVYQIVSLLSIPFLQFRHKNNKYKKSVSFFVQFAHKHCFLIEITLFLKKRFILLIFYAIII